jgi:hypoxanthine-guanine phosphoribosyltransferase
MSENSVDVRSTPGHAVWVEVKDKPVERGQPWISRVRCRERFNEVVMRWVAPRLRVLEAGQIVLLPVLDGGLTLYSQIDRYFDTHDELRQLERRVLPIRVRSAHGGGKFEIVARADHSELLKGRIALILDDITDTGRTLEAVYAYVRGCGSTEALSFAFLAKPRTARWPDFACFCIPDDLLLLGWGMDAGTGAGRHEEAVWDAADYIENCPTRHQLVGEETIRFAHSVGNSTLANTIRRLCAEGNWHGRPDILKTLAQYC